MAYPSKSGRGPSLRSSPDEPVGARGRRSRQAGDEMAWRSRGAYDIEALFHGQRAYGRPARSMPGDKRFATGVRLAIMLSRIRFLGGVVKRIAVARRPNQTWTVLALAS